MVVVVCKCHGSVSADEQFFSADGTLFLALLASKMCNYVTMLRHVPCDQRFQFRNKAKMADPR